MTPVGRSLQLFFTAALVFGAVAAVSAQPMTRCASCHFANLDAVPSPQRLADWQHSAHAKHVVGCHECHGGDPWTYVPADAHREVIGPLRANSPVAPANLARTCARCHQANAQAFTGTMHQTLLQAGESRAPNCTTCHGVMRADVPTPEALEARCAECHGPGSARAEYPARMRSAIESLNALRVRADALGDTIARVPEHARRVELLIALYNARQTLKDSVARVHAFDALAATERTEAARRQLHELALAASSATRSQ